MPRSLRLRLARVLIWLARHANASAERLIPPDLQAPPTRRLTGNERREAARHLARTLRIDRTLRVER
jgi:hypothetical protein